MSTVTVRVTNMIEPCGSIPTPTNASTITVNTLWEVDEDVWNEYDLSSLDSHDGVLCAPSEIGILDDVDEVYLGVDLESPTSDDIINEISGAFYERANNLEYYLEHEDEYDGFEDAMVTEFDLQYDQNIVDIVSQVLYGVYSSELDLDTLRHLSYPNNWKKACGRTYSVDFHG